VLGFNPDNPYCDLEYAGYELYDDRHGLY
jgi:hypothetical protein